MKKTSASLNNKLTIYITGVLSSIQNDKFLFIIPLLAVITRITIFLFIPHTYEDAFITFRYAENLADGFGLVYNLGERVYGTTTPLFAIILAAFKFIGIPCVISSLAINMIAEAATSLIVYKFLKDYSKSIIAAIVSLLYVFSPSNISWSIQGMETAFFSAIIALSFYSLYRAKYFSAILFAFLSAIIRIDGLSVVFIVFLFTLIEKKFFAVKVLFIPSIMFIAWLAFLYFYFGSILPNSMMAKLILYAGHQSSIYPNLTLVFSKFFEAGYYSSTIITLLFLLGLALLFLKKIKLYSMAAWLFIYYLALILSKTHIHGWYFIPPLFVFITISGIAIIFAYLLIEKSFKRYKVFFQVIFFTAVISFSTLTLYIKIVQLNQEYQYEQNVRMKTGKFLEQSTPENSTVFLEPIGVIGYYSQRYIYDDAALVSPVFLELNRLPYIPESQYKKIQLVKPDYLVIRDKYLEEFYEKTPILKEYEVIKNFKNTASPGDPDFSDLTVFERKKNL